MRINCPICGDRDRREFYYMGADDYLRRPEEGDQDAMHNYLHLRDNPAGEHRELWYHEQGDRSWLVVTRNTLTHEISKVELARDVARARGRSK